MKIEAPIPETQVPARKSLPPARFVELYEQVMKLKPGAVLPLTCATPEEAKKLSASLMHSKFAQFRVMQRQAKLYVRLWNEEDEKQRKHIRELQEKARAKKAGAA